MSPFSGFPRGTRYTPVPNLLLEALLEEIDDVAELKCTLRFLWLANQHKGFPSAVSQKELLEDKTLLAAMKEPQGIRRGLQQAVARGTLLKVERSQGGPMYLLHTQANREYVERLPQDVRAPELHGEEVLSVPSVPRPNIFALYEENIAMLAPLIAEQLKEAEERYPDAWIREAFTVAVKRNRRKWSYIEAILRRWEVEGKEYGELGRHPKTIDAEGLLRRYRRR